MPNKIKWLAKDIEKLINIHKKKVTSEILTRSFPNRTINSIYIKTFQLRLQGRIAKVQPIDKPINVANFSTKVKKRQLELETSELISQKGGWFGIPGPAIVDHWNTFKNILKDRSPFLAIEENSLQFNKMSTVIEGIEQISLIKGDLFKVLHSFSQLNPSPKVPLFAYGHLDFCKTATVLIRDYDLLTNLMWLAKWNQLKSTFFLDVSVSCRPDGGESYNKLFQEFIPFIFGICGWVAEDPRKLPNKFVQTYRDSNPMANALYKMVKKEKK
jgi:hypothetical protein